MNLKDWVAGNFCHTLEISRATGTRGTNDVSPVTTLE